MSLLGFEDYLFYACFSNGQFLLGNLLVTAEHLCASASLAKQLLTGPLFAFVLMLQARPELVTAQKDVIVKCFRSMVGARARLFGSNIGVMTAAFRLLRRIALELSTYVEPFLHSY